MKAKARIGAVLAAVLATTVLAGCGERPQTASGIKSDQPPHAGSVHTGFVDRGWTAGDRQAWAQHLRARAQYGQNEYSRPASASQ
jgi:hypothetical protein